MIISPAARCGPDQGRPCSGADVEHPVGPQSLAGGLGNRNDHKPALTCNTEWVSESKLFSTPLRLGYREPIHHGRFVGRSRELERLEEIMAKRRSATVLLAGCRGAGKTALVDEALRRSDASKVAVIRIAPPHIDHGDKTSVVRSQLLRTMARGLYLEAQKIPKLSGEIQRRIAVAYERTFLTELESRTGIATTVAAATSDRHRSEVRASVNLAAPARLIIGIVSSALAAAAGVGSATIAFDRLGTGWGIGAAIAIVLFSIVGAAAFQRTTRTTTDSISVLTQKDNTTEIAKLDLSDTTLEHELKSILEQLSEAGHQIVFVFDELDKLPTPSAPAEVVEDTAIFSILTCLKNFFTLGSAIFVFITDDAFYELLSKEQRTAGYRLSHTIFTDRIYLGPLHYTELEDLIDQSFETLPVSDNFDKFKNFVCWEANNHPFDALQVLDTFVEYQRGLPMLLPRERRENEGVWTEGNLPLDWLIKAALQKHVGAAYDESRRPGRGEALYNQALWDSLHETAANLLAGIEFTFIDDDIVRVPGRFKSSLKLDDVEYVDSAAQRMILRMERHGAVLGSSSSSIPEDDRPEYDLLREAEGSKLQYFRLTSNVVYPPSSIAQDSILLPSERMLVDAVTRVEAILACTKDLIAVAPEEEQRLGELKALRSGVTSSGPRHLVARSRVMNAIPAAVSFAESLAEQALHESARQWADCNSHILSVGLGSVSPHSGQSWRDELMEDFAPLIAAVEELDVELLIISGDANENALGLLYFVEDVGTIQDAYAQCLANNEKTREERRHRLPIVFAGVDTDVEVRTPVEIIRDIPEVHPTGWFARLLGFIPAQNRQVQWDLAGWFHFDLEGDLGNIAELDGVLNKASFVRSHQET